MAAGKAQETISLGPILPPGRYKLDVVTAPNLPAEMAVEKGCVVMAAVPLLGPAPAGRLAIVGNHKGELAAGRVGLLVVTATPLGDT